MPGSIGLLSAIRTARIAQPPEKVRQGCITVADVLTSGQVVPGLA
jgi:hypothetical protein